MRQKRAVVAVLVGIIALLCAPEAQALRKCRAKINAREGTILVSAKAVMGTLLWGWSATTQTNAFFNAAACVRRGTARKCTLGDAGTLLAITPPPDCTLHLKDNDQTCTAFLKKCMPGKRPVVEFPTRFTDNGDGTVTDTRTALMWEKKTQDGSVHDNDDLYTWSTSSPYNPDGTAFFGFLAWLNGKTPFAGYSNWRLPTVAELKTIVDLSVPGCGSGQACVDQTVFGPTQAADYWSASTVPLSSIDAWGMSFFYGSEGVINKTGTAYIRAVRGGL